MSQPIDRTRLMTHGLRAPARCPAGPYSVRTVRSAPTMVGAVPLPAEIWKRRSKSASSLDTRQGLEVL
jgi:hypothetical protein